MNCILLNRIIFVETRREDFSFTYCIINPDVTALSNLCCLSQKSQRSRHPVIVISAIIPARLTCTRELMSVLNVSACRRSLGEMSGCKAYIIATGTSVGHLADLGYDTR